MEENEQFLNDLFLENRAEKHLIYKICLKICTHKFFQIFINLCIIANTIVLAYDNYKNTEKTNELLDTINLSFYGIFVFEMTVKICGLGFKHYFKDKFNSFDFFIVIISSLDVALTESSLGKNTGT